LRFPHAALTNTKERSNEQSELHNHFLVDQTLEEVLAAINNVRGWWSGEIEGSTEGLGDEFTYRYKDVHYSKQKLVEVVPARKVVWLILDAWLGFTDNKSEWNGTKVIFEVSKSGDKTEVRFTHKGPGSRIRVFRQMLERVHGRPRRNKRWLSAPKSAVSLGSMWECRRGTSSWVGLIPKVHGCDKTGAQGEYMENFAVR